MFSEKIFDSDSSDDSDGIAANIDFENLDRIKESVKFNDEAEMLAINVSEFFSKGFTYIL